MTTVRLDLELPDGVWIRELSTRFPDTTFRLLTGLLADDAALELGEFEGPDPDAVIRAFRDHDAVTEYESLYVEDRRAMARYELVETSMYEFLELAGTPPEFPVTVTEGFATFTLSGSRERLRSLTESLEATPLSVQVHSVVTASPPEDLLTTRQREVVDAAVRAGYYADPRTCTLTDLAAELGVHPSTLSGILRRAEAEMVPWVLTASDRG